MLLSWLVAAAFVIGLFHFFANRAVYYPSKYPKGYWERQGNLPNTSD